MCDTSLDRIEEQSWIGWEPSAFGPAGTQTPYWHDSNRDRDDLTNGCGGIASAFYSGIGHLACPVPFAKGRKEDKKD